jgi:hypothetical protein
VTIDWGDGQVSEGQVVPTSNETFDVIGKHIYALIGRYRELDITVTVQEERAPIDPAIPPQILQFSTDASTQNRACKILPGAEEAFTLGRVNVSSIELGNWNTFYIANLFVADPSSRPNQFSGWVEWDDGAITMAMFHSGPNRYTRAIITSHAFATLGQHTGTLHVTGLELTQSIEVYVNVVPVYVPPPPAREFGRLYASRIVAYRGVDFDGVIGEFRLLDPDVPPELLKATISWGDGTISEGEIRPGQNGVYEILGRHVYFTKTEPAYPRNTYAITVRAAFQSASARNEYEVLIDPGRINARGESLNFRQREEFTTRVGWFTSPNDEAVPEDFIVIIDWGDGTQSQGALTPRHRGGFDVSGTHTYRTAGYFTILLTVSPRPDAQVGGYNKVRSTMLVDYDPVEVFPAQPNVTGRTISGRLATFTDEEGASPSPGRIWVQYAGLINWGDGIITAGTIRIGAGGAMSVEGTHTYAQDGDYTVRLVVRRNMRYLPQISSGHSPRWRPRPVPPRPVCPENWTCGFVASANNDYSPGESEYEVGKVLFRLHITGVPGLPPDEEPPPSEELPPPSEELPPPPGGQGREELLKRRRIARMRHRQVLRQRRREEMAQRKENAWIHKLARKANADWPFNFGPKSIVEQ